MALNCQKKKGVRRHGEQIRFLNVTLEKAGAPPTITLLQKRERLSLYRRGNKKTNKKRNKNKQNELMSVLCGDVGCWTLGSCGAVQLCSPWGGSRFTYCMLYKHWEEDICCSSSTTVHSIHFIPYSYPFPLLGRQLSTSGSIPGFIKLKRPLVGVGGARPFSRPFCSHFGIVRLAPTGRPWGCHRAHFSWEAGPLLAANSQTCITWKVLHRF